VEWLRQRVASIPVRLVFESSLELMESTQVGGFKMAPGGKSRGPPPAVKKVLGLFGSGREEDKMVGYLSFLKVGPKLLKFLPGGPQSRQGGGAQDSGLVHTVSFCSEAACLRS
jgi:magnesium chelatase subunit H